MSQWIKRCPVLPIHLSVLLVAGYFFVYRFSLLTTLLFCLLLGRLYVQYGRQKVLAVLPIILLCLAIFCGYRFQKQLDETNAPTHITTVQMIPDTIRVNGDNLSFQGKSGGRTYQIFYRLQNQQEQTYFKKVSELLELTVEAEVTIPDEARNFNGFDYRAYLRTKGIYRLVTISAIQSSKKVISWNPFDWIAVWRRKALVYVRATFPAPMHHYMTGLLFGDLDTEFDQMEDVYSSLGIIHLFALSGMQVGFFIDKVRYLLLRLGLKRESVDKWQLPFSVLYAGMTGWSISVIRSLVQKILGNQGIRGLDNMALTVVICYCIMPHFLLTAGGVLSFSYAFLLCVFDFETLAGFKRILLEITAISLGILPILIFYFYSFQPLSILLTFLFSCLFDVVLLPLLSILLLLSPLFVVTQVNFLFGWLENSILWIAERANFPLVFGKPSALALLILILALACIYDFICQKKVVLLLSLLVCGVFFFTKNPLTNEVTIVDIGQGDSILLRDYKGKTIVIDVGGKVEFGTKEDWQKRQTSANAQRTLIPYLKSRGIGKIDQLVLTHTDTDHVGDLEVVAKEIRIGEILVSPGSLTIPAFVERLQTLGVPVRVVQAGDSLSVMGSQLHVLYPMEKGDGGNDDSVVLYGKLLNKTFLFTGDLEEAGEKVLMSRYPDLSVDILKAGHHGSKGSSSPDFLNHIEPELALLSAGKNNRYKHPHQEVLERLEERAIAYRRTDEQGAIRFTGLKSWKLETVKK